MFGRARRRGAAAPVNATTITHTQFGADAAGERYFAALNGVHQTQINGTDGLVYVGDRGDPVFSFNGDLARSPQKFAGAAALALNGAAPAMHAGATFETARDTDPFDNVPLRIYAARAVRKNRGLPGVM